MTIRYVQLAKFCEASGYTEKAVRRKIEEGVWIANRHYRKAPDGHILIDTEAAREAEEAARYATCGVYLLCIEGRPVYVGRSTALQSRLAAHRVSGRMFDEIRVIPCDAPTSIWLERELIRTLHPEQNIVRYARHTRAVAASLPQ